MTKPAANPGNLPTISLGKQLWPVPELAPRQLREIRSSILEFNKMIGEANRAAAVAAGRDGQDPANQVGAFTDLCLTLSNEDYERLLLKPIFHGLTRAHPELTWEEFLDMSMTDFEASVAWFVVRRQSGLFAFESGENSSAGEA